MEENKLGRPTVMTEAVLNKLEEVFAIGGSDEEACFYADISKQTLYDYQKNNPEFIDRKEALKERPILKARQVIVKSLDNPEHSKWYLERKKKKEFSPRIEQEVSGSLDISLQGINDLYNRANNRGEDTNNIPRSKKGSCKSV